MDSVEEGNGVPHPQEREVGPHDQRTEEDGSDVGNNVLQWVGVDTGDANRCCPLVVDLVDVLVHPTMMEQSAGVV